MKKSNALKWGLGIAAVVLTAGAFTFFSLNRTSSSRIVLADEAKENSIMLHNANGDHACDCFQPWISSVTISNITSSSVDVTWDCGTYLGGAGPATYQVTYGTTTAKTSIYPTTLPTVTYTHYTVTVPNLNPNTKYNIGVKGCCLSDCIRGGGANMPKTFQQSPHVDNWVITTLPAGTTYTISGTITLNNVGVTGVLVTLSGGASRTMTTGSNGQYSFTGLAAGTYTVTPTKTRISFTPANKTIVITNANQTGQNFTQVTTGVLNQAVTTRASISAVAVAKVTAKDVTITWNTDIPAASVVEYGLTTDYGMKSGVNTEMKYNHYIQLFQLRKGATYHARAVSYAGEGATASYSADFSFKVPSLEDRISDRNRIVNEPNPATTWTMFTYYLYQPARKVTIDITSLSGRHIKTLECPSSSLAEGWNKVRWDNIDLKNGLYMYKVTLKTLTNMEEEYRFSTLRIAR